jgi:hypothetical protein
MMVNLIYFYDIISTMSRNIVNEEWTVRPHLNPQNLKSFQVSSVSIPYLSPFDTRRSQYALEITSNRIEQIVGRGCPIKFFTILINSMMNIGATITIDRFGNVSVVVNTFYHMKRHIDEAIQTMIDRSFFTDLSLDDANEIICILNLTDFIYCFEGHESGVCLVVLGPNDRAQNQYEQPWCLFKQAVEEFNKSRTIFMTPEQEQRLITCNENFKKLVEFTSPFNKTIQKVVFKVNNHKIDIIRKMLDVEKLTEQLLNAKTELQNMVQLDEMLDLQLCMFPK